MSAAGQHHVTRRAACAIFSPDPEDDEDDLVYEPDDPDDWRDEAEDHETLEDERADFNGWPVI